MCPPLTEGAFQAQVLQLARLYGWHAYHPYDSRRSAKGWPDLALVRPPRLVLVELKTERGRVTPDQQAVLGLLASCPGVETYLFRPRDWEEIEEVLRWPTRAR